MKVYHGSDVWIEKIDLSKGRLNIDFGQGFYVTNIRKHAHQRAIDIALKSGKMPTVTEFEYMENFPKNIGLSVKRFYEVSEEWVNFVIMNREEGIAHPAHSYDIVEGPIANDWVTFQILRYQEGGISMEALLKNLKYREETHQICLCTTESLWALKPVKDAARFDREDVSSAIVVALQRDFSMTYTEARQKLFNSDVFLQLFRLESKLHEQPWQQICEMLKQELKM
jgi:hypothetical protein